MNDNLLLNDNTLGKLIKNNRLTQIIDKPTRITTISATLLDLVITNNSGIVLSHVPQVIADHDLINVKVDISKLKCWPIIRTFCHLGNYSQEKLSSILVQNSSDIHQILLTDNANEQVRNFNEVFIKSLDECAPTVTKVIQGPFAPWMSDDMMT